MAYTGASVVDYLNSVGQDSSYANRTKLAQQYGISNYVGSGDQNTQLLGLLNKKTATPSAGNLAVASTGSDVSGTKVNYTGTSVVDYLNTQGKASDYNSRSALAQQYGISNYMGTADQNTQLLNLLKSGSGTTSTTNTTSQYIQDPNNPTASILNPNYKAGTNALGANTSTQNLQNFVDTANTSANSTQAKYFISTSPTGKVYKQELPQGSDYQSTLQFLINEANSKGNKISYEYPQATTNPLGNTSEQNLKTFVDTAQNADTTSQYIDDPNNPDASIPNPSYKTATAETTTPPSTGGTPAQTYTPAPDQNTTGANPNANLVQKDASGNYIAPTSDTTSKDQINTDLEAKFKEFTDSVTKNQETSQKAQEDIIKKMGETATSDLLKKYEETQKTISDSYNQYFTQQQDYLNQLQSQPSVVDQLNKFREQQGLPQMEKELTGIDQTILTTEGLLNNIEADIRKRIEGLPVSEAAARRLTSMEQAPLSKQLSEQLTARQRVAAGLEAKQNTVNQYMTSAQADLATQKEIAQAKLGVAKEQVGVKADIANSGLEAFQTVQSQMNDVYKIQLSATQDEATYKNELAKLGFDYYTQQQATKLADINDKEAFEQELFKIKLQNTLNTTNPNYTTEIVSDANGTMYQISINKNDPTDRIVKNLGVQGSVKTTGSGSLPTSYEEWTLAGGQDGTGKSYADYLNSKSGDDWSSLMQALGAD